MTELSKKLEAILFSVGDKISLKELSKLTREKDFDKIIEELRKIREKYENLDSPIKLHEEGEFWKMNVREEHMTTVRKVVKKMELSKTLLETLAVIAWKSPVKQSIVIAVRTNKAYDHLDQLESMGYITRKKFGRTKLINLTQKFYDYFEINKKGGLDRIFKRVTERAKQKYGKYFDEAENDEKTEESEENNEEISNNNKEKTSEYRNEKTETKDIDTKDNDINENNNNTKKLEIYESNEDLEVLDKEETGEELEGLKVYDKTGKSVIISDNENKNNNLSPENLEKLQKAKELLEQEKQED